MRLAVIPARGGSKRIPRKNIKQFCGKPMMAWSIEAARQSGSFDRIIVSTDDEEIAEIALQYGAEVPFMRSAELSDDYVGTIPVIRHAVETISLQGPAVTQACCVYATAPFLSADDLRRGQELLQETGADYVFSVTSYAFPIQRAICLKEDGHLEMFNPGHFNTRSQDLIEAFHDAGQFYWGRSEAWCEERIIFGARSAPLILPRYRVQDIDSQEDWVRAEWMFRAMQQGRE